MKLRHVLIGLFLLAMLAVGVYVVRHGGDLFAQY